MTNKNLSPEVFRVCDANLNRLKEGIRVVEDLLRFKYNNKNLAKQLKLLRHQAQLDNYKDFLTFRDSKNDILKPSISSELQRDSIEEIIIANFKRAEESSRVLEELFKLWDIALSERFKNIRYSLYNIEQQTLLNLT